METRKVGARYVSAAAMVGASPAEVFDLLRRPSRHSEFDGSGTVKGVVTGPEILEAGSMFGMSMRFGIPYRIRNRVVEFEMDRRIAWRHFGRHRWRYELEAVEGSCRVTETFDYSAGPTGLYHLFKVPAHNLSSIKATLERLVALFPPADNADDPQ